MSRTHHLILGYPNSGKTTFLAALWHVLDSGKPVSLVLDKLDGDVGYLNRIKSTWLKCSQAPRTLMTSEEMVELWVRNTQTQQSTILRLPDFSGEKFQKLVAERECDEELVQSFDEASGVLFFINADRANDVMSILDHRFDEEEKETSEDVGTQVIEQFDIRKVPEQTRIVDVLQLIQRYPFQNRKRRLVIAVSAWDVVDRDQVTPQGWVEKELPMLWQYLENSKKYYEVDYCGISAQGGDFLSQDREQLLQQDPAERVVCVWKNVKGSDLTLPLKWLSEDEG